MFAIAARVVSVATAVAPSHSDPVASKHRPIPMSHACGVRRPSHAETFLTNCESVICKLKTPKRVNSHLTTFVEVDLVISPISFLRFTQSRSAMQERDLDIDGMSVYLSVTRWQCAKTVGSCRFHRRVAIDSNRFLIATFIPFVAGEPLARA